MYMTILVENYITATILCMHLPLDVREKYRLLYFSVEELDGIKYVIISMLLEYLHVEYSST